MPFCPCLLLNWPLILTQATPIYPSIKKNKLSNWRIYWFQQIQNKHGCQQNRFYENKLQNIHFNHITHVLLKSTRFQTKICLAAQKYQTAYFQWRFSIKKISEVKQSASPWKRQILANHSSFETSWITIVLDKIKHSDIQQNTATTKWKEYYGRDRICRKQTTSYMKNKIMLPLLQLKKLQTFKTNERIWWC